MKSQLKTKIEDLIGHLGQSSPKLNGRWVDTGKTADNLLQLIQQTFESCLPEKEKYDTEYIKAINIIEYLGYEYNFVIGFNKCIDLMKSNLQAILEGKDE